MESNALFRIRILPLDKKVHGRAYCVTARLADVGFEGARSYSQHDVSELAVTIVTNNKAHFLTPQTQVLVFRLFQIAGVVGVVVRPFDLCVVMAKAWEVEEVQPLVLASIKEVLFNNTEVQVVDDAADS